ncbi:MAG TPA: hypothetical protein VFA88_06295 [Gaiellaceae bacterium]|nr:hypothetical protein [Gaiellaceae bacterium]
MNHPAFRQFLLSEHAHRLDERSRRQYDKPAEETRRDAEVEVVLRLCTVHDDEALERLAELEARPLPRGRFLVAEANGRLVAAQPLAGGPALADPFEPTAHVLPLMQLRLRQLTAAGNGRRFPLRLWSTARP